MSALTGPFDAGQRDAELMPYPQSNTKIWKGGAAAVVIGTGNALALDPTNVTHQFVGVFTESFDNTAGSAGSRTTVIRRRGAIRWNQSGIVAASMQEPMYFSDDNTVTATPGTQFAGNMCGLDASGKVWVDIEQAVRLPSYVGTRAYKLLAGSTDAINPHTSANYVVTTAGVDAMTLAAPTAVVDDFTEILVTSSTTQAHTITATGLLGTGTAFVNVATFAARVGSGVWLLAYNGKWNVIGSTGVTFS